MYSLVVPARTNVGDAGLDDRVGWRLVSIADLPCSADFDAATLIGVLHHLPEIEAKRQILGDIASRLKTDAPFVIACNHYAYASEPLRLAAWPQRWRMFGANEAEIEAKLVKIQHAVEPPESEAADGKSYPARIVDMFIATIPTLEFKPGVHVNYSETVLPMQDGLPS